MRKEKVKLALIGVGNIGHLHLRNIQQLDKVEPAAVCDIRPERAQATSEAYHCAGRKTYIGTPAEVAHWARECLDKGAPGGGMILSFGGGVSPGTPPENIDAMLGAARQWFFDPDRGQVSP